MAFVYVVAGLSLAANYLFLFLNPSTTGLLSGAEPLGANATALVISGVESSVAAPLPAEQCSTPIDVVPEIPFGQIEETWYIYPIGSKIMFANAAFWLLLWAVCACLRPFFVKLASKYTLLRKLTGDKILRTGSMKTYSVPEIDVVQSDAPYGRGLGSPYTVLKGEMAAKLPKRVKPGRLDQGLSRLILSYGSRRGFTFALNLALLSIVLALAQMRRVQHVQTDKPGYLVAWEYIIGEVQGTPWKLFQFLVGRFLFENSVVLMTGAFGAGSIGLSASYWLCNQFKNANARLTYVEHRQAEMPTAPPPSPSETLMAGIRAGLNSSAADEGRRLKSLSRLDTFVRLKRDASTGYNSLKSRVRDPTIYDFGRVPRIGSLPPLGPSIRRSPSYLPPPNWFPSSPSAPPADEMGEA